MERYHQSIEGLASQIKAMQESIYAALTTLRKDVAAEFAVKSSTPDSPPGDNGGDDDDGWPSCLPHPSTPPRRGNLSAALEPRSERIEPASKLRAPLLSSYAVSNSSGRILLVLAYSLLLPYSLYRKAAAAADAAADAADIAIPLAWTKEGKG